MQPGHIIRAAHNLHHMFKYILESAGNINWMAIAALVTFFTMFVISAALVFKKDVRFVQHMASLPLDDSNPKTAETEANHEA